MNEFPEVECDHNGHSVPHIEYDIKGRKEVAYGTISGYRNGGSDINNGLRNWIEEIGDQDDDGGHIIPRCLFGSGRDKRNMFPQNREVNRILGISENRDKQEIMERNLTVKFKHTFNYNDKSFSERPIAFIQEVRWFESGRLVRHFEREVENPMFSECNKSWGCDAREFIVINFDTRTEVSSPQQVREVQHPSSSAGRTQHEGPNWERIAVAAGVFAGGVAIAGIIGAALSQKKERNKK